MNVVTNKLARFAAKERQAQLDLQAAQQATDAKITNEVRERSRLIFRGRDRNESAIKRGRLALEVEFFSKHSCRAVLNDLFYSADSLAIFALADNGSFKKLLCRRHRDWKVTAQAVAAPQGASQFFSQLGLVLRSLSFV